VAGGPRLPDLLRAVHQVEGVERIRFLTSHPTYFDERLLEAIAGLPKVCEHIEVPIQAGHDEVLARMKRGYTVDDYRRLVAAIRERLPGASIATDVIVGFPGETEVQFQATLDLLAELKMDVCHVAMYSPRPGTVSAKTMGDDVPPEEKKRRLQAVNDLQERIVADINHRLLGQRVEILVEEEHKGKWKGRTRTNKLVFFSPNKAAGVEASAGVWLKGAAPVLGEDSAGLNGAGAEDRRGRMVNVKITWTGPWSMQGEL